ncbi:MAG: DUF1653 domain-containing protein [Lachnospiraceae bacterium]|jgi:Uncharacterized protein conserved in bacteria|nr:DUF1653 domain-containing protein [Lachnospiraceae bacterium]
MPQGNPRPGEQYLHFKQNLYQVITVAEHSETAEKLVIYQALYGDFKIYARPFQMFISPVDQEKYPQIQQTYRFQLVEKQEEEPVSSMSREQETKTVGSTTDISAQDPNLLKSKETAKPAEEKKSVEDKLMAFFDAETMEEKYKILVDMQEEINDRVINNMAVVLDVVIEEGPLERRYEELKTCVRTFQRYECNRFR